MSKPEPLFNARVLRNVLRGERARGAELPSGAASAIDHWIAQLQRGVLNRLSESSAEQTFNNEIFGTVLGYEQIGRVVEASMLPKRSSGRDTPDFVLGRFDLTAGVEEWWAVGEIKDAKTDLDQPQVGRTNRETPVEQSFRYAMKKPGVEWVIVTNLREVRLYKNGYIGAYHAWNLEDLGDREHLFEFYILLRPEGLLDRGREAVAARAFQESISAGRDLTEGFYSTRRFSKSLFGSSLDRRHRPGSLPFSYTARPTSSLTACCSSRSVRIIQRSYCRGTPCAMWCKERRLGAVKVLVGASIVGCFPC
jgi:hypothetical protein